MKKRKTIIMSLLMMLILIVSTLLITGCGSKVKITEQSYTDKVVEFNMLFDGISKDFYEQCKISLADNNSNVNSYKTYKDDVVKLNNIFSKYDEKTVPSNKVKDLKDKQTISLAMQFIEEGTGTKDIYDRFIKFYDKRNIELGISNTKASQVVVKQESDLEIIDKSTIDENGSIYVIGTIVNNSKEVYSSVFIGVNLYEEDGKTIVGNAIDSVKNLGIGEKYKFKCNTSVNFKKYSITDVYGYK